MKLTSVGFIFIVETVRIFVLSKSRFAFEKQEEMFVMSMHMIKGLFFDFDGVITMEKEGSPTIISYISKETNIPYETIENAYYRYNDELLYGNITHRDMWREFCADVNQTVDFNILGKAFMNVTIDEKILEYIREKRNEYLIGMITDNKADRIKTIVNNTALKGLFDVIIISSDVHSRKSERMIFEEALKQSGLKAEECVFIDNSVSNLDKPSEMGFTTIYFDDDKRDYSRLYCY